MTLQAQPLVGTTCGEPDGARQQIHLPVEGLSHGEVLRVFDILRRRVAVADCGDEGAFVGYDWLHLAAVPERCVGQVAFSAVLVETGPRWHRVAYEATYLDGSNPEPGHGSRRVLAKAVGCTVGLGLPAVQRA